jgi:hypothetical protein
MSIRIVEADLNLSEDCEAVLTMVDAYSMDAMAVPNHSIPMCGRV